MKSPKRSILLAMAALAVGSQANAAVLASEDFTTYAPSTNLQGKNGGTGWGGSWAVGAPGFGYLNEVRNATPLSYPNDSNPGGNYANLASGYGGPSFNYIQRTVDVGGAFSAYNDGVRVGANGTTLWGSFSYYNVGGLQMYLQGATNKVFSTPTVGANSLYVFRIDYGAGNADTITIWNNPNLTTWNPSSTPTATSSSDYSFQTLVFVAPNSTNEGRLDAIRFGTQAIDVVPYTVPEPASMMFAGLSAAMLLRRRRTHE